MSDLDNLLVPPWSRLPLVHDDTDLFPEATMTALSAQFAGLPAPQRNGLTGYLHADAYDIFQASSGDSSAELQAAYDRAAELNCPLYIPAGAYPIRAGLRFHSTIPVILPPVEAWGYPRSSPSGGVTLYSPTGATQTTPVLHVEAPDNAVLYGQTIKGLFILGSDGFNSPTARADRPGLYMKRVLSEVDLDVQVTGFQRQGLHLVACMDGRITGRIMTCGTDQTYPSLSLDHVGNENCNALRFTGLHIENAQWQVQILGPAMHNEFLSCKFEVGAAEDPGNLSSPITVASTTYGSMTYFGAGCQFTYHSADDATYRSDATEQAAFFNVSGASAYVRIEGSYFTAAAPSAGTNNGSRWLKVVSGMVSVQGNIFDLTWVDDSTGDVGIILGDNCLFSENTVKYRTRSNRGGR